MSEESARISALGKNNCVAKPKDSHAMEVNPASLANLEGKQVVTTYEDRFLSNLRTGAVELTLNNVGFKIDYVNVPDVEKRDESGTVTGNINYNQIAGSVGAGFAIENNFYLGIGLNASSMFADGQSSFGITGDLGAIFKAGENIFLGCAIEDIDPQIFLGNPKEPSKPPTVLRVGGQWSPIKELHMLGGASFFGQPDKNFNIGAEYEAFKFLKLRTGCDFGYKSYGILTTGLGMDLGDSFQFDYAFRPHPSLGMTNVITLTMKFKNSPPDTGRKEKVKKHEAAPARETEPAPLVTMAEEETIKIDLQDKKSLKISAGEGFFVYGTYQLTADGAKAVRKTRRLLSCLNSLGLIDTSVPMTIEGNACPAGDEFINEKLSSDRAIEGLKVLYEALGIKDLDDVKDNIMVTSMGERKSTKLEGEFIKKWKNRHGGETPSDNELENFRQGLRNFNIIVKINVAKWGKYKNDPEVVSRIAMFSKDLPKQLDSAYRAAKK